MKNSILSAAAVIASLFLTAAATCQADQLRAAAICSGAARLDNGSIICIGQPFAGVMTASGGGITLNAGIIPVIIQSSNIVWTTSIASASWLSGSVFSFQFDATLGRNYLIEASTNLSTWTPLLTNLGAGSSFPFFDSNAAAYPRRFYRVGAW